MIVLTPGVVRALDFLYAEWADKAAAPGLKPKGPNPYLALLPDATKADYSGWANYLAKQATAKAARRHPEVEVGGPRGPARGRTLDVADETTTGHAASCEHPLLRRGAWRLP